MKNFNLLYDSTVDGQMELIKNTMSTYKVENTKLIDINGFVANQDENYFHFVITGQYTQPYVVTFGVLPIPYKIKELVRKYPNVYVGLLAEHESDDEHVITTIEECCVRENLNPEQLIVINGNQKIKTLIDKSNSKIRCHTTNRLQYVAVEGMNTFEYQFRPDKESFFMCYNRMIKPHRIGLLVLLKREGILDEIDWSLLRANEIKSNFTNEDGSISFNLLYGIFDRDDFNEYKNEVTYFYGLDSKKSKFESGYKIDEPPYFIDFYKSYEMNPYGYSYINIVTETNYNSTDIIHITEKSLIPFYYSQIPLILGNYEHNKFIKNRYNLDLFEDIIDYSYDMEMDPKKRLFMFVEEIKRLRSKKDEIIDFYKNNEKRFKENKNKILGILKEKVDYDFFKSLI